MQLAAALVAFGAPAPAQAQTRTASPAGRDSDTTRADLLPAYRLRLIGVYDFLSGQPVDSVTVTDLISGLSARTTPTGTASLFFLPDGGSLVRLRKLGYQPQNLEVHISPDDTEPLTVLLEPAAMLPTVVSRDSAPRYISPALGGFEQRQRAGFGNFIDEAEMRKKENWTMANLVTSHFSGLMIAVSPHGEEYVTSTRKMCAGLVPRSLFATQLLPLRVRRRDPVPLHRARRRQRRRLEQMEPDGLRGRRVLLVRRGAGAVCRDQSGVRRAPALDTGAMRA